MDSGYVKVVRVRQLTNLLMSVSIYIDEVKAGTTKSGERKEFNLPAGWHTVQAKSWAGDSTLLAVEIKPESPVVLICRFRAKFDLLYGLGEMFKDDWLNFHTHERELREERD